MAGKYIKIVTVLFLMHTGVFSVYGNAIRQAPPDVTAALIVKLLAFEKNLGNSDKIIIYVLGDQKVAEYLTKAIGEKVGKATISEIIIGSDIPNKKYSVLFVGNENKSKQAMAYTRENNVLSITDNPDQVSEGITLGIGVGMDNKPKIFLNVSSSIEENLDWNPAILKSAKIIK